MYIETLILNCWQEKKQMKTKIFLSAALFIILLSTNFTRKKIPAKDTADYIGDTVTVVDTVSGVYLSKSGIYFLNMGDQFSNNALSAVIFKSDASKFHDIKNLKGEVVEVTGRVKYYHGKPEIEVEEREQVKVN
jgi:DNA/RNA endonuclease YhcR with UshA esterase domain